MALTSSGIQQAREIHRQITGEESKLTDLEEIIHFMEGMQDFSQFIAGTKFGREYYEKWNGLISLISGDLYQALANIDHATYMFLDRQEEINNRSMGSSSGGSQSGGSYISGLGGSFANTTASSTFSYK